MKVQSRSLAIIVIAVVVVGIGAARAAGWWITESTKIPAKFTTGEFEGEANPADIRGSYTFADIESAFAVPLSDLAAAFNVGDMSLAADFRVKDLEETYDTLPDGGEVGTDSIRLFVSLYTGLPYVADETTRLPEPAVEILTARLAPEELDVVASIAVPVQETESEGLAVAETEEVHDDGARVVKGDTTFSNLSDWGLTGGQIEEILGIEPGPGFSTVRDYAVENGLQFGDVKTRLQEVVDAVQ